MKTVFGSKSKRSRSYLSTIKKISIEKNSATFRDSRHRVTKASSPYVNVTKISSSIANFFEFFFLPSIVQSVCYKPAIDSASNVICVRGKIKNYHDTLNFLVLSRHRVSLGIFHAVCKQ